jgi:hypothetical protein
MERKVSHPKHSRTRARKPQGFSPEQVSAAVAARDKSTESTPRAVVNAFVPDQVMAGTLVLQPVTMSTILLLQKISSTVLKSDDADTFNLRDIASALFILTQPAPHVRMLIQSAELDSAVDALMDTVPAAVLPQLGALINAHIETAFSTAVPMGPKGGADSPLEVRPLETAG